MIDCAEVPWKALNELSQKIQSGEVLNWNSFLHGGSDGHRGALHDGRLRIRGSRTALSQQRKG